MKKIVKLISTLSVFIFLLTGCNNTEKEELSIKEVAYQSLSSTEKIEVMGDVKKAIVTTEIASKKFANLQDESFIGKEIYVVTFQNTRRSNLGDIRIFIDPFTRKVLEKAKLD